MTLTAKRQDYVALCAAARRATRRLRGSDCDAQHLRRAFDLAHRARRLLEATAETAARDRWTELAAPSGPAPKAPEALFAALCAGAAIRYPVDGEAAVYAALLDAIDTARRVSDRLYNDWLGTQRTERPLPVPRGVNRLSVTLAAGCSRANCHAHSDEENAS